MAHARRMPGTWPTSRIPALVGGYIVWQVVVNHVLLVPSAFFDPFHVWWSVPPLVVIETGIVVLLANYYVVVTRDPGYVPLRGSPATPLSQEPEEEAHEAEEGVRDDPIALTPFVSPVVLRPPSPAFGRTARWCGSCQQPKPVRAHHCRRCGRCVHRMDHHCLWTGGCVGAANLRAFLRVLGWGAMLAWLAAAVSLVRLVRTVWALLAMADEAGRAQATPRVRLGLLALNVVGDVPIGAMLAFLGAGTLWHAMHDTTTIEQLALADAARVAAKAAGPSCGRASPSPPSRRSTSPPAPMSCWRAVLQDASYASPYDRDAPRANLEAVLGPGGWWHWVVGVG
ncbi:hypothetical protein CXG81DRAFT_18603 [Caulochytrium protostelioides]|nr:hypothetical protein CXG81DRAFT_18603 [Caulochytrium protostelioides]|eukprot:RKP01603.1 hypothetical protein CXG81DRAFT_18603 [Caulochytrium protostelioides]